ncbi:hypothetical protein ACFQL1_14100 [Halomicroarcula sp. GCM10025709]|uniref:mechanosensitive ion channel family protein n=1 Tax=Halomicroarcula sp. GCM10025709 TaxID=3252669 RepID=UPI003617892D
MPSVEPSVLQLDTGLLGETIAGFVDFLPQLVGAVLILVIGWFIGRLVGGLVRRLVDRTEIDRLVLKTPLGGALGGSERAVSTSLGRIGAFFVYALAILAAADALAIELLSQWIADAVSYLPALIAGLLIIVIGFVLADFLSDIVAHTETVTDTGYTDVFADGLRAFLYFVTVIIGLGTMGVDVQILNTFAQAAAWASRPASRSPSGSPSDSVAATTSPRTSVTGSPDGHPIAPRPPSDRPTAARSRLTERPAPTAVVGVGCVVSTCLSTRTDETPVCRNSGVSGRALSRPSAAFSGRGGRGRPTSSAGHPPRWSAPSSSRRLASSRAVTPSRSSTASV